MLVSNAMFLLHGVGGMHAPSVINNSTAGSSGVGDLGGSQQHVPIGASDVGGRGVVTPFQLPPRAEDVPGMAEACWRARITDLENRLNYTESQLELQLERTEDEKSRTEMKEREVARLEEMQQRNREQEKEREKHRSALRQESRQEREAEREFEKKREAERTKEMQVFTERSVKLEKERSAWDHKKRTMEVEKERLRILERTLIEQREKIRVDRIAERQAADRDRAEMVHRLTELEEALRRKQFESEKLMEAEQARLVSQMKDEATKLDDQFRILLSELQQSNLEKCGVKQQRKEAEKAHQWELKCAMAIALERMTMTRLMRRYWDSLNRNVEAIQEKRHLVDLQSQLRAVALNSSALAGDDYDYDYE